MRNSNYVQYGCGWCAPREWRNFDASPTLRFERLPLVGRLYTKNRSRFPSNVEYGDIVKGLPVPASSCKGVYCCHILEHLSLNEFRTALGNTQKILQPGGLFRMVLPDLEFFVKCYIESASDSAAIEFMEGTSLGHQMRVRGLKAVITAWLGNSRHLWMWDYKSVKLELENAGLVEVRRAFYGDSLDPFFKSVEEMARWTNCLGVECRNHA